MTLARVTIGASVASGLCGSAATGPKVDALQTPIIIGGAVSTAACPGGAEVVGLDPQGDDFLSVRSVTGGRGYSEVDRIQTVSASRSAT